ncbi:hypothetical protein [Xenophilus sp. Marseille-Q4582]|uniref:hypothetical protein n=1 Tax=Xenophilus sp. Marseille-Q4582 TaxID=2866600 RepID=UPI001CE3CEB4|nr:hypothetical protein [Xenophilus sp. Marseille-Q4582]
MKSPTRRAPFPTITAPHLSRASPGAGAVSRRPWLLAGAALAAASLWLRMGFPAQAVAGAGFDDALFVRLAYALGSGQWLGAFDRLTLAKGMGYPLFIALSAALAIPLKLAEHLLYLGVSAALATALARRLRRPGAGLLLFAALAFNPVLWHPELARIIREGLYLSESLALLGLGAALLLPPRRPRRGRRTWALAGLAGLVLAAYWCTREEGVWLLPALATMAGAVLADRLRRQRRAAARHAALAPRPVHLLRALAPMALAALVGVAGVGLVKSANHLRYGVFLATEFQDERFQRAYGALARIRHDQRQPYVVFPADARRRAYAASAAARELRPALEGENGDLWRRLGCAQTRAEVCPEVLSGWFMWALRDAVWLAGHYESAPRAMAFYERLAREIDAACDSGAIACDAPRAGLAPAFQPDRLPAAAAAAAWLGRALLQLGDGAIGVQPSTGRVDDLAYLQQMVGRIAPPAIQDLSLALRWDAVEGAPLPALAVEAPLPYAPAQWRWEQQTEADAQGPQRLRLLTDCSQPGCRLRVGGADARASALPLQSGGEWRSAAGTLRIEDLRLQQRTVEGQRMRLQQAAARAIAKLYAAVWPLLTLAAFVGWAGALWQWLRRPRQYESLRWMMVLSGGALVAVLTRIALLAWLDAIAIPSTNLLYASPAAPMVLLFTVLGLLLGAGAWRTRGPVSPA